MKSRMFIGIGITIGLLLASEVVAGDPALAVPQAVCNSANSVRVHPAQIFAPALLGCLQPVLGLRKTVTRERVVRRPVAVSVQKSRYVNRGWFRRLFVRRVHRVR